LATGGESAQIASVDYQGLANGHWEAFEQAQPGSTLSVSARRGGQSHVSPAASAQLKSGTSFRAPRRCRVHSAPFEKTTGFAVRRGSLHLTRIFQSS
jgi:hypothetical protein